MGVAEDWRGLIARLATLQTDWPIAWENETFTPGESGYLAAQVVFSTTQRIFIQASAPHLRIGFLQVSIMARYGRSTTEANAMADMIIGLFPADLRLGNVRITSLPHVGGGFRDGAYWHVPVTIEFEAPTA